MGTEGGIWVAWSTLVDRLDAELILATLDKAFLLFLDHTTHFLKWQHLELARTKGETIIPSTTPRNAHLKKDVVMSLILYFCRPKPEVLEGSSIEDDLYPIQ